MKNLLLALTLALPLLVTGAVCAQEQTDNETGVKVHVDKKSDDGSGIHINIDSDEMDPEEVKQKLKEVIDALATKIKNKVDTEVEIDIDDVSEQDLKDLEKLKIKIDESDWDSKGDHRGIGFGEVLVALTAISFTLGLPIIILFLVFFYGSRKRKQKMELINNFVSRDQPVPPELVAEFDTGGSDPLRSGLQWAVVGLAIVIAFVVMGESSIAALGLIPLGLGVARLIYWKLNTGKEQ
ncbi:MAG: hypothetical protein KJP04_02000 [Arenicella sp.]|nr:hypothetical protein [Arenicella sp.]